MKPSPGRIVTYRSSEDVDMPAIITAIAVDGEWPWVHLQLFVPPGAKPDLMPHEWGVEPAPPDADPRDPNENWRMRKTWRWPERVE